MEEDLEQLAKRAEIYDQKKQEMDFNLENEKKNVQKFDDKIKKQKEQYEKDSARNQQLRIEIQKLELEILEKSEELEGKQSEIRQSRIYEEFLLQVAPDFIEEDYNNGPDSVIHKFDQLTQVQKDLISDIHSLENKYNLKNKDIQQLNHKIEEINLKGTSEMNKLKKEIDGLLEQNRILEQDFQGKEKSKLQSQIDEAQYIMAIKNIYYQYQTNPKIPEKEEPNTENLLEMIKWIENKINHLQFVEQQFKKRLQEQ